MRKNQKKVKVKEEKEQEYKNKNNYYQNGQKKNMEDDEKGKVEKWRA